MTEKSSLLSDVGQYKPAPNGASRSPCPVVNALANHGHLRRDGRKILAADLYNGMITIGLSPALSAVFAHGPYNEYVPPAKAYLQKPVSIFTRIYRILLDPYSLFATFGCWRAGNTVGNERCIDLEDLASHDAIEHDCSLSRRDAAQKQGNNVPQEDLIEQLLASSSDGVYLTMEDVGRQIKKRIRTQLDENPNTEYGPKQYGTNCGEVALIMHTFGNGHKVPLSYVKAIFVDERLPKEEGWSRRSWWWRLGFLEFLGGLKKMQSAVGITL